MPIYEYRCSDCDRPFEELVRSSTTKVNCPLCSGTHVERQLSVFAPRSGGGMASAAPMCDGAGRLAEGVCCGGGACGRRES